MRKWAALLVPQMLATCLFAIGSIFYGIWGGVAFFLVALLLGLLIGVLLLRNPFQLLLEGKGILAINMDSTGVLQPFIVNVQTPYIKGRVAGVEVNDVFDRAAVSHLAAPRRNSMMAEPITEGDNKGGVRFELDGEMLNKGRFAMFHYPVILYNAQLNTIITKDWFADKEKDAFAEHGVLYLNRKMEELTSVVRDFGRAVVELLKPKESMFGKWWVWLIIGVFFIILIVMFGPSIMNALGGAGGTTATTVKAAAATVQGSGAITPVTPAG